jgi:hypothetical protein
MMKKYPKSTYRNERTSGTAVGLRGAVSSALDLAPPSLRACVLAPLDPRPPQPHTHFDRCSKALSGLLAVALLGVGVAACGGPAKATGSTTQPSTAATPGGHLHADGDHDGDDGHPTDPGQDDQGLLLAYGGPAHAPPATTRTIEALVKRYYAASLAGEAAGACALLGSEILAGLIAEQGESSRGVGACATAIAPVLAQLHDHLVVENPATMVVIGVYVKGDLGLVLLGFKHSPESDIVVQREGSVWKVGALFDNEVT